MPQNIKLYHGSGLELYSKPRLPMMTNIMIGIPKNQTQEKKQIDPTHDI